MSSPQQTRSPSANHGAPTFFRWQMTTLVAMYVGYAAFMVCRNTLIASSAEMIQDPTLGLDKESFGHLMSWHSAGAILGKLVTGPGADLLGGRRMFLIALAFTAMANVGFAFGSSFFAFATFNFLGQFAKAGGWPAMTKLVGSWYPETRYGQVWSVISTSSRVGTIIAGVMLGYLLSLVSWRLVFVVSAVLTFVVVGLLYFLLKDHPEDVGLPSLADHQLEPADDAAEGEDQRVTRQRGELPPHPVDSLSLWQACWVFARSGRCWFICFSIVFLTIVMDFLTFIPIYLSEALGLSASQASMAGSSFPAGMFFALVFTSFVYDRLSKTASDLCARWSTAGELSLRPGALEARPGTRRDSHARGDRDDFSPRLFDFAGILRSDERVRRRLWWQAFWLSGRLDRRVWLWRRAAVQFLWRLDCRAPRMDGFPKWAVDDHGPGNALHDHLPESRLARRQEIQAYRRVSLEVAVLAAVRGFSRGFS